MCARTVTHSYTDTCIHTWHVKSMQSHSETESGQVCMHTHISTYLLPCMHAETLGDRIWHNHIHASKLACLHANVLTRSFAYILLNDEQSGHSYHNSHRIAGALGSSDPIHTHTHTHILYIYIYTCTHCSRAECKLGFYMSCSSHFTLLIWCTQNRLRQTLTHRHESEICTQRQAEPIFVCLLSMPSRGCSAGSWQLKCSCAACPGL